MSEERCDHSDLGKPESAGLVSAVELEFVDDSGVGADSASPEVNTIVAHRAAAVHPVLLGARREIESPAFTSPCRTAVLDGCVELKRLIGIVVDGYSHVELLISDCDRIRIHTDLENQSDWIGSDGRR